MIIAVWPIHFVWEKFVFALTAPVHPSFVKSTLPFCFSVQMKCAYCSFIAFNIEKFKPIFAFKIFNDLCMLY